MEGEESKKEVAVSPPQNIPDDTSDDQDSESDSTGFETPPETMSNEEKEEHKETDNGGAGDHNGGAGYVVSDVSSLLRTLDTEGVLERKIGILIKDGEEEEELGEIEEEVSFEDVDFDDLPGGETKPSTTEKSPPPLSLMDPASLSKDLFLIDKIEDFLGDEVESFEEPRPQDNSTDMQGVEPHLLADRVHLQENEPENDPQFIEQHEPDRHDEEPTLVTCSSEERLLDKPHPQDDLLDEPHPQENEVPLTEEGEDEPHPQNEENNAEEIEPSTEYNETNEPLPQEEVNEPLPQEDNEPRPQEEVNERQQEDINKPHPSPQQEVNHTQEEVTEQKITEPHPQEDNEPHPQEDNEPLPQEDNEPLPQEDNEPLPQEDNEPLPQEDNEPLPQEDNEPLPQEDNEPLPQEDNEPLPQEVKVVPLPQEDNEPLPQEDNEPLSQEDNEPLPQEDNEPLPQEDNKPLPQEVEVVPLPQEDNEPLPQEDNEPLPQEDNEPLSQEDNEPLPQEIEGDPQPQEEANEPYLQEDYVIIKDDKCVNTELILNTDKCVNTELIPNTDIESQTDTLPTSESSSQTINPIPVNSSTNTTIDINELIQLANIGRERRERDESIQSVMAELNQERSQRLVNDQLVKILETDVTTLQQRNVTELSDRLKLENELSDLKAEYAHSQNELKDSKNRVNELEESLSGTLLLVRKLEEQSATITNKGGVDYLLQAKIADGRAHEAEQQLQVLQAELLQSQAEVKRLLDRLGELSRGRQEMVSGAVHSQLLELSDRRAEEAERRVRELEQQVVLLKSSREGGGTSSSNRYMETTGFPSLTSSYKYPLAGMGGSLITGTYSSSPSLYSSNPYVSGSATTASYFDQGPLGYTHQLGGGFSFNPKQEEGISPDHGRNEGLSLNKGDRSYAQLDNKTNDNSLTFSSFLKNQNSSSQSLHETTGTTLSPPKEATPTTLLPPVSYNEATQSLLLPPISNDEPSHELLMSKPSLMNNSKDDESDDDDDWSTSDEEGEGREETDGGDMLRPTAHMNLRSKFEWLSAQNTSPSSQQSLPTLHPEVPQATPTISDTGRRVPPPIAPKPKLHRTISADIKGEGPISFDEVIKPPSLKTYIRPRGPRGRRPPSGY